MLHRIVILTESSGSRIEPGHLTAGRGDTIIFGAVGSDVLVDFPFQGDQVNPSHFTLENGQSVEVTINSAAELGSHSFSAYCRTGKRFAKGGSDGEIVVGP